MGLAEIYIGHMTVHAAFPESHVQGCLMGPVGPHPCVWGLHLLYSFSGAALTAMAASADHLFTGVFPCFLNWSVCLHKR